jgi:carbonic anhydrase/acetyltransferase-like protein (isoleucine patch superfamily)
VNYRKLTETEIARLQLQLCRADNWSDIEVVEDFTPEFFRNVKFTGKNQLGKFGEEVTLAGGVTAHTGIYDAWIHNCSIGNNVLIHTIRDYVANYTIENNAIIFDVKLLAVDGESSFGNGISVETISEAGNRSVMIYDKLSAQLAYILALYRHRPELIDNIEKMVTAYSNRVKSSRGTICSGARIYRCDTILNVKIGKKAHIEGARLIKNGTVNSEAADPVYIGDGCHMQNFIICSGSKVNNATLVSNCFIGQGCILDKHYSADNSLFFSNCQGLHGEACSIFAGPFTVTHHKSTLLIAGMFSFLNAGSGSNQSNHMYKLGPIHQGFVERGSKTASDSYVLWPAKIGAFTLISGRHYSHCDTSELPFSYLIEHKDVSYLSPAVNLRSIGTIRDSQKWPKRDVRKSENLLDCINYNLLSPFTVERMIRGRNLLLTMREKDETCAIYQYQGVEIEARILSRGIRLYENAIWKFLGNSLITQLEKSNKSLDKKEIQSILKVTSPEGSGKWVDISGMICPSSVLNGLLNEIENGKESSLENISAEFKRMHHNYYNYEWTWAYGTLSQWYGKNPDAFTPEDVIAVVMKWLNAVLNIDRWLYEDAQKEFALTQQIGFGIDGDEEAQRKDFENVRGSMETDDSVLTIRKHMEAKEALGKRIINMVKEANGLS